MPLTAPERITRERAHPQILSLWWALRSLTSCVRFLNTGAHPDDEISAMLAALWLDQGLELSYACANRGEGGQNDIGSEATAELGALRTAEMERAADVLSMRLYWLSEGPDDTIFDFGFSKSGEETLGKWGRDRTLRRFVEIVRSERPDILCPTFLDVPGQHGHHRAMTALAHEVMGVAADPAFATPGLSPWTVTKMYLPAWSGAGQAYDDDLPPPPATLTVPGRGRDPVSGWSYARIGQQSRAFHKTQGMGHWVPAGTERDFPLHLAHGPDAAADDSVTANLPADLGALADIADAPGIATALVAAQSEIEGALDAFPDGPAVARRAAAALRAVTRAQVDCLEVAGDQIAHRLTSKARQLGHVIRLASGVDVHGIAGSDWLRPGETTSFKLETQVGTAENLTVTPVLPSGWTVSGDHLSLDADAGPSNPYRAAYDPTDPPAPCLEVAVTCHHSTAISRIPLAHEPFALPSPAARITPTAMVLNRAARVRHVQVKVSDAGPANAATTLEAPDDWQVTLGDGQFEVTAPADAAQGLATLTLRMNGAPATSIRPIAYPHTRPTAHLAPAQARVLVVDATLPDARVGYIGAGNDRVDHWLTTLGMDVSRLSVADLRNGTVMARIDTLVIGIFALRFRDGLLAVMPGLHDWVRAGGNLVTLYHRPWDNWDADTVPPRRLEIGQPSLRWRVTDETAEVTHLAPDHRLLNWPNAIGPTDWHSWHKERGLYFAKSWDAAYQPLVSMGDPDEAPHQGALLAARVGRGQHVHTSLILHHQMEKLVPGAFRLMANLVARPD